MAIVQMVKNFLTCQKTFKHLAEFSSNQTFKVNCMMVVQFLYAFVQVGMLSLCSAIDSMGFELDTANLS